MNAIVKRQHSRKRLSEALSIISTVCYVSSLRLGSLKMHNDHAKKKNKRSSGMGSKEQEQERYKVQLSPSMSASIVLANQLQIVWSF
jgi:hypothetical protein